MRIVKPAVVIETDIASHGKEFVRNIERFARRCYKSEDKITDDSYEEFVGRVFHTRKHRGIIEHATVSVTFVADRGVSHEAVRHRMASFLQESTRYCDYGKKGVTYVLPPWVNLQTEEGAFFKQCLLTNEQDYLEARKAWKPEQARGILAHFLKTEWTQTMNLGSWYNFFSQRAAANAHPCIRQIAVPTLRIFRQYIPVVFDDIPIPQLSYEEAVVIPDTDSLVEVYSS